MLNWRIRYAPVVRLLDAAGAKSVLDVGSGRHGISWFRPGTAVQTDLTFGPPVRDGDRVGRAQLVAADAARLPFADGSFDAVVSCDMIEHLAAEARAAAIREVTRVARRLAIVGFPIGRRARRVDRALAGFLGMARLSRPAWLDEHLGQSSYPDRATIATVLPRGWEITEECGSGNVVALLALSVAESVPAGQRLTSRVSDRYRRRGIPAWWDSGRTYRTFFVLAPTGAVR